MTDSFSSKLKLKLENCIHNIVANREIYVKDPARDFIRTRKLPMEEMLKLSLLIESSPLQNELLKQFDMSIDTPSKSAFIQQREKLKVKAFSDIFHSFTDDLPIKRLYKGYQLLACDGSAIPIPRNVHEKITHFDPRDRRGHNEIHLHAFFDVLNGVYTDFVLSPKKKSSEQVILRQKADSGDLSGKKILIADRGYCTFRCLANLKRNGVKYLIRAKDIDSNGFLAACNLPDTSFDRLLFFCLYHDESAIKKRDPRFIYYQFRRGSGPEYITDQHPVFRLGVRVIRFPINELEYECLITNLENDEFSSEELQRIYKLRWGIEGSFRDLKYTIDLLSFHSKQQEFIEQEIISRLILYNFCEVITRNCVVQKQKKCRYDYRVNFTSAVRICRAFLRGGGGEILVDQLLLKYLIPIRKNRRYTRQLRCQTVRSFLYRAA